MSISSEEVLSDCEISDERPVLTSFPGVYKIEIFSSKNKARRAMEAYKAKTGGKGRVFSRWVRVAHYAAQVHVAVMFATSSRPEMHGRAERAELPPGFKFLRRHRDKL